MKARRLAGFAAWAQVLCILFACGNAISGKVDAPGSKDGPPAWPGVFVTAAALNADLATDYALQGGPKDDGKRRRILVLDARPPGAFDVGHLPGAQDTQWTAFRAEGGDTGRLPEDLQGLAARFAAQGVDANNRVLVCGAATEGWGEEGRIAWTLRVLGHKAVALLDGGCQSWVKAGGAMTTEKAVLPPGVFSASANDDTWAQKADVLAATTDDPEKGVQILDTRTAEEYAGATPFGEVRGGHIPTARHLWFEDLMKADGNLKDKAEILNLLRSAGIDEKRVVITYCTGGVRSAFASEVLIMAGVPAKNYAGSFWEWAADPDLPVEGGG
jgi:thiosulfate/3-mercaptopyruvate sulfurtransferase